MKTLLTFIVCFFFHQFSNAQEISLRNINSSNILDFYQQNQNQQQQNQMKSIDIATQVGDGNTIQMQDRTPSYIELVQTGNYNTTFFENPNNYPTNAEIKVKGSGNYIDVTGSNSISDGMKININANDVTIFMRNY